MENIDPGNLIQIEGSSRLVTEASNSTSINTRTIPDIIFLETAKHLDCFFDLQNWRLVACRRLDFQHYQGQMLRAVCNNRYGSSWYPLLVAVSSNKPYKRILSNIALDLFFPIHYDKFKTYFLGNESLLMPGNKVQNPTYYGAQMLYRIEYYRRRFSGRPDPVNLTEENMDRAWYCCGIMDVSIRRLSHFRLIASRDLSGYEGRPLDLDQKLFDIFDARQKIFACWERVNSLNDDTALGVVMQNSTFAFVNIFDTILDDLRSGGTSYGIGLYQHAMGLDWNSYMEHLKAIERFINCWFDFFKVA